MVADFAELMVFVKVRSADVVVHLHALCASFEVVDCMLEIIVRDALLGWDDLVVGTQDAAQFIDHKHAHAMNILPMHLEAVEIRDNTFV